MFHAHYCFLIIIAKTYFIKLLIDTIVIQTTTHVSLLPGRVIVRRGRVFAEERGTKTDFLYY